MSTSCRQPLHTFAEWRRIETWVLVEEIPQEVLLWIVYCRSVTSHLSRICNDGLKTSHPTWQARDGRPGYSSRNTHISGRESSDRNGNRRLEEEGSTRHWEQARMTPILKLKLCRTMTSISSLKQRCGKHHKLKATYLLHCVAI